MADANVPSPEFLRKLLRYDESTGKLYWRQRPLEMFANERSRDSWNKRWAGKETFTTSMQGYKTGTLSGKGYLAHRVIWAMHYGKWPDHEVDHKNCIRSCNLISNLRDTERLGNNQNSTLRKDNCLGFKGVGMHHGKFRARIRFNGKPIHLGYFPSAEEAHAAYCSAAKKYHGEFARTH